MMPYHSLSLACVYSKLMEVCLFRTEKTAYTMGVDAFIALLEGARVDNELRARKFIARSLWLMKVRFSLQVVEF